MRERGMKKAPLRRKSEATSATLRKSLPAAMCGILRSKVKRIQETRRTYVRCQKRPDIGGKRALTYRHKRPNI